VSKEGADANVATRLKEGEDGIGLDLDLNQ
jgi:hypothetical protein